MYISWIFLAPQAFQNRTTAKVDFSVGARFLRLLDTFVTLAMEMVLSRQLSFPIGEAHFQVVRSIAVEDLSLGSYWTATFHNNDGRVLPVAAEDVGVA